MQTIKRNHIGYHPTTDGFFIECEKCHELFIGTGAAFAHRSPNSSKCLRPLKCGLTPRIKQEQRCWDTFRL